MSDTLSKNFEVVENRIAAEDIRFCQAHQAAYEQSCSLWSHLAQEISDFEKKQKEILSEDPDAKWNPYFLQNFSAENIWERLKALHRTFIAKIIQYFSHRYHISITPEKFCKILIPQCSEHPHFYCCYVSKDRADYAELEKKDRQAMAEHHIAVEEYTENIRSLRLSYESVVEQIFAQIGGTSLQEKAVSELKENAHQAAWSDCSHSYTYETKKNVVMLSTSSCFIKAWNKRFALSEGTKNIVKALAYFEYGACGVYGSFQNLLGHDFFDLLHCINGQKVKQVKCYKNGRMDIKFTSEAYAQEFAETYLGTKANVLQFSAADV